MHGTLQARVQEAREIEGRLSTGRDTFVQETDFAHVCKHFWPGKTAAKLAEFTGRDERTAKRWLSGEFDPPPELAAPILARIFPPKRK